MILPLQIGIKDKAKIDCKMEIFKAGVEPRPVERSEWVQFLKNHLKNFLKMFLYFSRHVSGVSV